MPAGLSARGRLRRRAVAGAAVAVAALAACGSDERQFDAEGVVAALNDAGAGLALGDSLDATEGQEVRVVTFTGGSDPAEGDTHEADAHGADAHGAGAVVILDGADAARGEFARCESAISFVCFRAANAVLRFSSITPAEQRRITTAVAALETPDDG